MAAVSLAGVALAVAVGGSVSVGGGVSVGGRVSVIVAVDSSHNKLLLPPKITTAGFVYQASGNLIATAEQKVNESLTELMKNRVNFSDIKTNIKATVGKYLFLRTQRNPMIIPVIMNKTAS